MKGYFGTFKKFLVFKGRAKRSELWGYIFFTILFIIVSIGIDMAAGMHVLSITFPLLSFFPGLSLTVRRLHDITMSGFYVLILPIVPAVCIGAAIFATELKKGSSKNMQVALITTAVVIGLFELYIGAMPSTKRANKYGELPGVMSVQADDGMM